MMPVMSNRNESFCIKKFQFYWMLGEAKPTKNWWEGSFAS
jgi:hypothetical protein